MKEANLGGGVLRVGGGETGGRQCKRGGAAKAGVGAGVGPKGAPKVFSGSDGLVCCLVMRVL